MCIHKHSFDVIADVDTVFLCLCSFLRMSYWLKLSIFNIFTVTGIVDVVVDT